MLGSGISAEYVPIRHMLNLESVIICEGFELACDEQRVLADHEIPTDRGVPGVIGTAVALPQAFQAQTPELRGIAQVPYRGAIVLEEELVLLD